MARRSRALMATLMGTAVALGGVEIWASIQPIPRIQQVFEESAYDLQMVDGIATWHGGWEYLERWNLDCTEQGRADVVLLGSSIFFGVHLDFSATLGHQLAPLLGSEAAPACVVNLAQPGSAFENQDATARLFTPKLRPRIVIWELWHNSVNHFTRIGSVVYNFGRLQRDRLGLPNPLGIPPVLNRVLFQVSAGYRYLDLTLAEEDKIRSVEHWSRFVDGVMAPALRRLQDEGAAVLLVYIPRLSRPFARSTVPESLNYQVAEAWAKEEGVPTLDLAAALGSADPEALGLDSCCHLNEEGTRRVAEILAGEVRRMKGAP